MLKADLHNKLASGNLTRKEDLLTSNVLGSLTYLPATAALLPWLRQAQRQHGPDGIPLVGKDVIDATVSFWPRAGAREPDAVLLLHSRDGSTEPVVIECKYLETLSQKPFSTDPEGRTHGDQLVDYWRALNEGTLRTRDGSSWTGKGKRLLYITRQGTAPERELEQSWNRLLDSEKAEASFFWLSWRALHPVLTELAPQLPKGGPHRLVTDLVAYLEHKSLLGFRGFSSLSHVIPVLDAPPTLRERWSLHPPGFLGSLPEHELRPALRPERTDRWNRLLPR
ncbi:hypothetical protein D7X74_12220 [Corallococcus sp. CA047B]|uniref:hypothetical protein n=1 Tax=Corallococcus sp. CA047B TaxID=2316729 RepID=UPI000EA0332D|nr:hypothetical protein [Corallococcus sp. CA047B]RKH17515.1 hypothetical protein D7X74_12220 [Corallococcus sp. CA047B]